MPGVATAWVWFSWFLLVASMIGWPASQLTFAKSEPPTILALSWAAIIIAALGNLVTAIVNRKIDPDER